MVPRFAWITIDNPSPDCTGWLNQSVTQEDCINHPELTSNSSLGVCFNGTKPYGIYNKSLAASLTPPIIGKLPSEEYLKLVLIVLETFDTALPFFSESLKSITLRIIIYIIIITSVMNLLSVYIMVYHIPIVCQYIITNALNVLQNIYYIMFLVFVMFTSINNTIINVLSHSIYI